MVLSFSACSKQDANSELTSGTSDIASTETNEENKESESTPETDNIESGTEGENPQNSTPTKPTESTTTTTNNKPTTTTKPSNTEPKDESTNNKNDTPTTSIPTQKPTEKPTEEKPYYVGFNLVSIERKYTKVQVDGMHLFDKVYGKNKMLQKGDVVIYKINMSDGGNTGFTLAKSPILGDYAGHTAKIEGNLIKVTANGSGSEVDIYINANDENGRQKTINLGYFNQMSYTEDISKNEALIENILKDYGRNLGMEYVDGFSIGNNNNVFVDIPNNNDWLSKAIDSIEKWHKTGMKKFFIVVNFAEAFSGVAC